MGELIMKEPDYKTENRRVLHEIQRNTQMAINSIEEVYDKVYDEKFMGEIKKQGKNFVDYERKALTAMGKEGIRPFRENPVDKVMLKSGIMAGTLLNTSTGHIAEMMIQGNYRNMTELCRTLNHNPNISDTTVELAKELMDFEEEAIKNLKKYL